MIDLVWSYFPLAYNLLSQWHKSVFISLLCLPRHGGRRGSHGSHPRRKLMEASSLQIIEDWPGWGGFATYFLRDIHPYYLHSIGKKESYQYGTLQKKQEIAILPCVPEKKIIYNKNDGIIFQKCEQSVYWIIDIRRYIGYWICILMQFLSISCVLIVK